MKKHPLPYFSDRKMNIDMLMLHCAAHSTESMIESLTKHELSCHYIIGYNGEITQCVDEKNKAWHAGMGYWNGYEGEMNSRSIGIEISNETLGQSPYNPKQIDSLIKLCHKIIKKYNINPQNIVGHSDTAPTRKPDPGICFPWKELSTQGIGLWYKRKEHPENDIQKLLGLIGYNTNTPNESAYAFCRHFLPEFVETNLNIPHFVDNIQPTNYTFMKSEKFLKRLKQVAYTYTQTHVIPPRF